MLRLVLVAALAGVTAGASVAADPEKGSKTAAVDKVIQLLEDLQQTVLAEGEKEAATYNKFACFCKDTTKDKSNAITEGEDSKDSLTSEIGKLQNRRDQLDDDIKEREEDIEEAEKAMKEAEEDRSKELKKYKADEADLTGALSALEGAIQAMKASKPSLVQLTKIAKTLDMAAGMADALGLQTDKAKKALAFLQQTDVPMENYKFHSADIISTLEDLLKDFKATKADVDAAEVEAKKNHNLFMQEKENFVKTKEGEIQTDKKEKDNVVADIATNSQDLSTTSANLLADKEYLMKLSDMCSDKAKTWDARSQVRQDELSAITQAIAIVSGAVKEKTSSATARLAQQGMSVRMAEAIVRDPQAMEAVEADAEAQEATASLVQRARFLRRHAPKGDASQAVMDMLLDNGKKLHSAMLSSLASQIGQQSGADKFAKIKTLISQLIERLLAESAAEANQKGWCDKALSDATQKRDYAAEEVMTLNANLAELEATRDKLAQDLKVLAEEIAELKEKRKDASDERDEEKTENEATVKEANEGLDAVREAIDVLEKFYGTAKNAEVDLSLAQKPETDAPDAGFDNGEAYKGASGKAGGVIGMLEVIEGDFQRTVSETEAAEKQAEQDHLAFMTETGKSLAEKGQAEKEKSSQKDNAESEILEKGETLTSQSSILKGAVKELIELKATCIDTGMSYEERVARRAEEMASLKKALCIFENFEAYGPDASGAGVCA